MKILVIHGPNLNMLGKRETDVYGKTSLDTINKNLKAMARKEGSEAEIVQSNYEGKIVETIQKAAGMYDVLIINPAAFTHTSIAIRDAILAVEIPTIEVHLTNIYRREEFRHKSFIAPAAIGQITGFGENSYYLAMRAALVFGKKKS
jgi:3-dehydroquinate dehydratase II